MSANNVIPFRGVATTERELCLRAQMVLGYISEQAYWRAIERAKGGQILSFVKPTTPGSPP